MDRLSIIKENEFYDLNALKVKLRTRYIEDIKPILLELSDYGCVKITAKSGFNNNTNVDRVFREFSLEEIIAIYKFAITFVGIIKLKNDIFIAVYPKYISKSSIDIDVKTGYKKIKQIIQVIAKYRTRKIQHIAQNHEYVFLQNSILGLKINILERYFRQGLYFKEDYKLSINGEGEALWDYTINNSTSYIINKTPVYIDLVTREKDMDFLDIIREIHGIIISDISRELEEIFKILDLNSSVIFERTIDDLGTSDYIIHLLEEELSNQFVTERINMLKELILYMKEVSFESNSFIQLYGTTSFNLVWEDVCRVVYQNHLDFTFEKLGISNPKKDSSDQITMKEYIEKPQWLLPTNTFTNANSTLELDVLNIQNGRFNIYDAKYYNICFENGGIQGQPGVSDITKQYLYQLLFKDVIKHNELVPSNNFIIPKDELENDNELFTISKMNMFHELEEDLREIKVIARDCQNIYKEYLDM